MAGGLFARVSGLLDIPDEPVSFPFAIASRMRSGRSDAYALDTRPCVLSVHTNSSDSLNWPGTGTLNTYRFRRGKKCVGWPRSAGPGWKPLSGPTGISISSSQFLFSDPKMKYFPASGSTSQPSYAAEIGCPLEYVSTCA